MAETSEEVFVEKIVDFMLQREWVDSRDEVLQWCKTFTIPAFGGKTAQELVGEGEGQAVLDYLIEIVDTGGFQ